jgi:hypothetical protein
VFVMARGKAQGVDRLGFSQFPGLILNAAPQMINAETGAQECGAAREIRLASETP